MNDMNQEINFDQVTNMNAMNENPPRRKATTKKQRILDALSEHRYRSTAEVAQRCGEEGLSVSTYLSQLYGEGRISRRLSANGKAWRYILRPRNVEAAEPLSGKALLVLQGVAANPSALSHAVAKACGVSLESAGPFLTRLYRRGLVQREKLPGTNAFQYQITEKGRKALDIHSGEQPETVGIALNDAKQGESVTVSGRGLDLLATEPEKAARSKPPLVISETWARTYPTPATSSKNAALHASDNEPAEGNTPTHHLALIATIVACTVAIVLAILAAGVLL